MCEKAAGAPRVLIFDGHRSHTTTAFITCAMRNNIILLQLPPHTSHLLQLLDVGLFRPVKTFLSQELERLTIVGVSRILKAEWVEGYGKARKRAFTVIIVKAGWCGVSLFLFNPEKNLDRLPSNPPSKPTIMSTTPNIMETALLTSSPPDITVL